MIFRTESPTATRKGKVLFLPVKSESPGTETIEWKIWILSTRLASLYLQTENTELLQGPARQFDDPNFETEVFIIGGGNA